MPAGTLLRLPLKLQGRHLQCCSCSGHEELKGCNLDKDRLATSEQGLAGASRSLHGLPLLR